MQTDFYEDRLRVFLEEFKKNTVAYSEKIEGFLYKPCEYKVGNELPVVDESFKSFEKNDRWGGKYDAHAWFYKKLIVPKELTGKNLELTVSTQLDGWDAVNPQFIAYVDGKLQQGLDVNHREIFLDNAKGEYDIFLYAYSGRNDCLLDFNVTLNAYYENARRLYYKIAVPYEVTLYHEPYEKVYVDIENYVVGAINLIDMRVPGSKEFLDSVDTAEAYLDREFYGKYCKKEDVNAVCIGHTHIDVAWLWTLAQTREKVLRSFSTVLELMKKYPEYKFMSSQAQLYKFLKEESPELYAEVKEMVRLGRWEVEGAMWVEADCNLSSGESLVRQILYGKSFFKNEFGVDSKVLWLPDVFGYSAALPQILRKSGVDKFVTSKIGWSETDKMPYDTFFWKGIDGTDIFTYFMTAQDKVRGKKPATNVTYNAKLNPCQLIGGYDRYQQKDINNEVMITFGYGDGGGGPIRKDLEYYDVLKKGVSGVPCAKMEFAGSFLERIKKRAEKNPKTPCWQGELYLEYHRGTYTSMAQNKKLNRRSEFLYENAEMLSVTAQKLLGKEYPREALHGGWETILLNQFHDIIPGSSIKEVYEVSHRQYEKICEAGKRIKNDAETAVAENINTRGGVLVFNPNSFEASGETKLDGKTVYVKNIPPKGYKVVTDVCNTNSVKVTDKFLENRFFKIKLDKTGAFSSLFDKKNKREVLKKGERGNVLTAYEDIPRDYDNWEISNYYTDKSWEVDSVVSIKPLSDGVRAGIEITRRFLSSTIVQRIWLYENTPKIDFENDIDWKESHILLKTAFPTEINADKATYDIQFGTVERPTHKNTSWDAAKFEVCAHKFADLSEYGYGVSLLNDCKYGYDIHDSVIRLTLIKCGNYPNPDADKCRHKFTYSLFPHSGDFREAGTVKLAYLLNSPLEAKKIESQNGTLPEEYSLLSIDSENVICETVKNAEDGDGVIVRLYECCNSRANVNLTLGFDFDDVYLTDLLENEERKLRKHGRTVNLTLKPFEIVTLKLK